MLSLVEKNKTGEIICQYDFLHEKFTTISSELLGDRYGCAAVVLNNEKVVVFGGGTDIVESFVTNESMNEFHNGRESLATMPISLDLCAALKILENEYDVYLVGGYNFRRSSAQGCFYKYNINTNTYKTMPSMIFKRAGLSTANIKKKLYAIGGMDDGGNILDTVECYDDTASVGYDNTNSSAGDVEKGWHLLEATMNEKRYGSCSGSIDGIFYVIGGMDENKNKLNSIEMYDTKKRGGSFQLLKVTMKQKRHGAASIVLGFYIIIIGGKDENGNELNTIEIFNTKTKKFVSAGGYNNVTLPTLATGRSYCAAVLVDDFVDNTSIKFDININKKILVIGGVNGGRNTAEVIDIKFKKFTGATTIKNSQATKEQAVCQHDINVPAVIPTKKFYSVATTLRTLQSEPAATSLLTHKSRSVADHNVIPHNKHLSVRASESSATPPKKPYAAYLDPSPTTTISSANENIVWIPPHKSHPALTHISKSNTNQNIIPLNKHLSVSTPTPTHRSRSIAHQNFIPLNKHLSVPASGSSATPPKKAYASHLDPSSITTISSANEDITRMPPHKSPPAPTHISRSNANQSIIPVSKHLLVPVPESSAIPPTPTHKSRSIAHQNFIPLNKHLSVPASGSSATPPKKAYASYLVPSSITTSNNANENILWAPPQKCPPMWSITYNQLMDIGKDLSIKYDSMYTTMTMIDVNEKFIKPYCESQGTSIALGYNPNGCKVDVFVTHCWYEPFLEFVNSIKDTYSKKFVKPNLWICAFALHQGDEETVQQQLGTTLEESPFVQALQQANEFLIVRNRIVDLYSRIWCVCEVMEAKKIGLIPQKVQITGPNNFSKSTSSVLDAQATKIDDRINVMKALLNEFDVVEIDDFVEQFRKF